MRKKRNVVSMEETVPSIVPKSYQSSKQKIKLDHLKTIFPLTDNQKFAFQEFAQGQHIVLTGYPGVGKSYLSLFLALKDILTSGNGYNKIIIVRSARATVQLGHLPGDLDLKLQIFEQPYKDIVNSLVNISDAYEQLKNNGLIEFHSTSYLRSLTWDNYVVIFDEASSATMHEIDSVITRCGNNTRYIICGDHNGQCDITSKHEKSGYSEFLQIIDQIPEFSTISFNEEDIVRSEMVKKWIIAKNKLGI
jgi:phosphate starvation-inducible protein PhoH